jgi:hypothetical protein
MILKNNLSIISYIIIFFLGIFFFNLDYKYSPDVESNIRDVKIFINNQFDLKILFETLTNNRSIESNVYITIFIYTIGVLIDNLSLVFFIINFTITLYLFYLIKFDFDNSKINKFYFHLFCYLYLLNPDLRLWQSFLLIDYFFTVLIFIHFRFLIKKKFISSIIILFLLIFIRPTSIFIIPITFLFFLFNYFFKARNNIQIYFLILSAILAFVSFSFLFTNVDDLGFFGSKFKFYKDFNISGIVIHDRWSVPFEINNFYNLFTLLIIKFFAFYQFLSSDFSIIHNIYNLIYYAPYLFIILMIFKKIHINDNLYFNEYYLLSFYFFIIYGVCHSILLIDFDWRYRMPLYIPFIISIIYFLHECKLDTFLKKIIKNLNI